MPMPQRLLIHGTSCRTGNRPLLYREPPPVISLNSAVKQKENLQVGDDMKGRFFDIFNIAATAVLILAGVLDVVKGQEIFDYVYFAVILVVAVYTIWRIVKEKSKKWYHILFVFLLIFVTGLAGCTAFHPQVLERHSGLCSAIKYATYVAYLVIFLYTDRQDEDRQQGDGGVV